MVQILIILLVLIALSFYIGFREGSKFVWFKVISYLKRTKKSDDEILDILTELSKEEYIQK
jgi:hypothetical protein